MAAIATDTRESTTLEVAKVAQDAARRYMDESASIGRTFVAAWGATVQAGLRTAFDLQNAVIQASRTILDASAQANRNWFDQGADSMRKSQDATAKLMASGLDMVESIMPKARM